MIRQHPLLKLIQLDVALDLRESLISHEGSMGFSGLCDERGIPTRRDTGHSECVFRQPSFTYLLQ